MNEILVIENQLVIAETLKKKIIEFEKKRKMIEKAQDELKKQLYETMTKNGITHYESPDETLKISCGQDTIALTFDSKKLQEEDIDTYRKYLKETPRKGSIRITVKEKENDILDTNE